MRSLTHAACRKIMKENDDLVILDTRDAGAFMQGFIPGSVYISLNEQFTDLATSLVNTASPILLVAEGGKETEIMDKLSKAGFTDIRGYLEGGLSEWLNAQEEIDMIIEIEADELAMDLPFDDELLVLDIRQQTEFAGGHVRDAMNMPLKTMNDPANMAMIEETCNIYIMGGSDMKQVMAAALLKRQGFHNLRTIEGGWESVLREKRIETVKEKEMLN